MMNEFIVTKEYKRFTEFCKACQKEKYMGLCYGAAGVGKSMSAVHFAQWDKVNRQIYKAKTNLHGIHKTQPDIDMSPFNTVVYVPEVINSPRKLKEDFYELFYTFNHLKGKALYGDFSPSKEVRLKGYIDLLIIDEADRLQPKCLEQIRDIYDQLYSEYNSARQMSVILIGMPGIEKRLIRFPQLYSRIGFAHAFKPLSHDEVAFIIQHHCQTLDIEVNLIDFMDHEAIATVTRVTQGNFRLINRLLKQSLRIMEVNQLSFISKEVIEAARECLVIGNVY